MRQLHIVQGGIVNGDKKRLERAASRGTKLFGTWITPSKTRIGDDVVVFIRGLGFVATARATSDAHPRTDWKSRWGASIGSIRLINPPISLGAIRRHLPMLTWAIYPRSITTPAPELADRIRELIAERRRVRRPDLDDEALEQASLEELRSVALLSARPSLPSKERAVLYRARSRAIHLYVLKRSEGQCEGCKQLAPFVRGDGTPYLEPHHITRVADDGPDHPDKVIALCPNCHRRAHHSEDKVRFNSSLKKTVLRLVT